jgi:hypothetical protein
MEDIGREEMGKARDRAEFKEDCNSLGVRKARGKTVGGSCKCGGLGSKVGTGELGGANWLTKETGANLDLGRGAIEEGEGFKEVRVLGWRKVKGGGFVDRQGEDFGFSFIEVDTVWRAAANDFVEEPGEVDIGDKGKEVVKKG